MNRSWSSLVVASLALSPIAACSSKQNGPTAVVNGDDSSDASASPGDGASPLSDAGGAGDVDPDAVRATACTAPPFVGFQANVHEITNTGLEGPLAGATIGFTSCSGFVLTTDGAGVAVTQVTSGIAYSPLFTALGHINAIGAESPATSDGQVSIALPLANATAAFPEFTTTKPTFQIAIDARGTTPPCNSASGVTLAVTNHPEAIATYMPATWPVDHNASGTSSSGGPVFFTGLAGGLTVQITGAKAGCKVTAVTSAQTGNFQLVNGLFTLGSAVVTD